jgi:hypothetical protein
VKVADLTATTHNPSDEIHWASCLRENLTSSSYGEGLETGCGFSRGTAPVPYPTVVFQMDQAASSYQTVLWDFRERGEDTDLDRRVGVGVGGHREKALEYLGEPLRNATDLEPDHV